MVWLQKMDASFNTSIDIRERHLFTPQEACKLLPDIKPRVKELVEQKKIVMSLRAELERYNLLGFRPAEFAEKAEQLEALFRGMNRKVDELQDLGVFVTDLDYGLVDFPAERYGENVMLCWKYGEPEVSFWHGPDEGYKGRRALRAQLIQP
jgi:hypothetical protein